MTHEEFQEFERELEHCKNEVKKSLKLDIEPYSSDKVVSYNQPQIKIKIHKDLLIEFIEYAYENLYDNCWLKEDFKSNEDEDLCLVYVNDNSKKWEFEFVIDKEEDLIGVRDVSYQGWDLGYFTEAFHKDKSAIAFEIKHRFEMVKKEVIELKNNNRYRRRVFSE